MRPYGLTMLRWCVGAVFLAHGAQKLFGMWGGPGLDGTSAMLRATWLPMRPQPRSVGWLHILEQDFPNPG